MASIRQSTKILITLTISLSLIFPSAWAWEIDRPRQNVELEDRTESAYTNGKVSVGLGAAIDHYTENYDPYGGRDYVNMNVSMTANSRLGITYSKEEMSSCWIPKDQLTNPTEMFNVGDDWGMWVNFPSWFVFRFYGGKDSAKYKSVWVSSNGFVSFDLSNSTSSSPTNIPWDGPPNNLIAALWTDLRIDSSASIIMGLYERGLPGRTSLLYFVITWNNALHEQSGERLTFQIALEMALS